jgi:hypothetical protein
VPVLGHDTERMPIAAAEGMLVPRPAPGPAFWLLALFVLPALNTALFYLDSTNTLPDLGLPDIFGLLAFLAQVAIELGLLAYALSQRGLTRGRRHAWLAAGAAFVFVQTCLLSVVALVIVVLVGLNHCGLLESGCT